MTNDERASMLARVRELDAAATKGPWASYPESSGDTEYAWEPPGVAVDDSSEPICYVETGIWHERQTAANLDLIAEYRTLAPALRDECERLAALCHEQRITLEKVKSFGSHGEDWDGVSVSYFVDKALKLGDQS